MANAEDIKKWLKEIGKNRQWLAEKTLVSKWTVNGWLSTGKPIPSAKLTLIEKLMHGEEEIEFELPPDFEAQLRSLANDACKKIEDMVSYILQVTAKEFYKNAAKGQEDAEHKQLPLSNIITGDGAPRLQDIEYYDVKKKQKSKDDELIRKMREREDREARQIISSIYAPGEETKAAPLAMYTYDVIGNIAAGALAEGDTVPYPVKIKRQLKKGEYILKVNGKSMEPKIMDGSLIIVKKYTIPPIPKPGTIVEYYDERGVTLKKLVQRNGEYVLVSINPEYTDIEPMDGGKISAVYVETIN